MKSKECFKCGETKPLSDFYKHAQMADGHVNKCKECNKRDVRENRKDKVDYYREYDRSRGNRLGENYQGDYRKKYPKKAKARGMVSYHKRMGNLIPEPCEICGCDDYIHAHHDDYDKPLNVRWLCAAHHRQWHIENGEGANAS